jgi:precorrin-4/cobalt-precorrin-4 C11-methyltransferase
MRAMPDSAMRRNPVLFVGAGPGDPELITVRGMRALEAADVVLYAGSLVPTAVLSWTREDAERIDSAGLALEEQVRMMADGHRAGMRVVRLHTGDPALFGATAEQWERLEAEGVPYEVVPGVSSLFASAAALPAELTVPGVSQAVIICRAEGRTPVPAGQDIASLAAHRATMAVFLSAGLGASVAEQLGAHYALDTPAAIVQRASWPEQRVVRCTVGTLADALEAEGIDRTAMVLVGEALSGAGGRRSHLYDPQFEHGYREAYGDAGPAPAPEAASGARGAGEA